MFLRETPLATPVRDVMSTTLHPATPDMTRDEAAEILEKNKIHHAVVNNIEGKFAGLYSSWDIARECALDSKVRTHTARRRRASYMCFPPRPLSYDESLYWIPST